MWEDTIEGPKPSLEGSSISWGLEDELELARCLGEEVVGRAGVTWVKGSQVRQHTARSKSRGKSAT